MKKIIILALIFLLSCDSNKKDKKTDLNWELMKNRTQILYHFPKFIDNSDLPQEEKDRLHQENNSKFKKMAKIYQQQNKILSALVKNIQIGTIEAKKESLELREMYWKLDNERMMLGRQISDDIIDGVQGKISKKYVDKIFKGMIDEGIIYIEYDQ